MSIETKIKKLEQAREKLNAKAKEATGADKNFALFQITQISREIGKLTK